MKKLTVIILVAFVSLALVPLAYADTSWIIGTGGIPLTSLTEDSTVPTITECGDIPGHCTDLVVGSNTIQWTHDSGGSYTDNNAGIVVYLPGSESNMSTIDHVDAHIVGTHPSGSVGVTVWAVDTRDAGYCVIWDEVTTSPDDYSADDPCTGEYFDELILFGGALADYSFTLTVSVTGHTVSTEASAGGENSGGTGVLIGPYRPVKTSDTWVISDEHGQAATKSSAPIHSIGNGTITAIAPVASMFSVTVAPFGAETEDEYIKYYNLQGINGAVGDVIEAGCVLGLVTDQATDPVFGTVGLFRISAPQDILDDWPDYEDSPTDTPCNAEQLSTENCIDFNPNFANNAEYWNSEGHVEAQTGGPVLYSDGAIYQDVTLDSAEAYNVTIVATTVEGARNADLEVTFGDATSLIHLNVPVAQLSVRISSQDLSPGTADYAPDKYRLKVRNVPRSYRLATPVQILFFCIGTTDPVSAPGSCYFERPDAFLADDWETEGGATYAEPLNTTYPGSFTIPADALIFRDVDISAFSDSDTTFTLETKTWNGAGTPLFGPYGRWHAYIRDSATLDIIQEIGTWDTYPIIATIHSDSFTLLAGENVSGDLVIENLSSEITSPGWTQHINMACLSVEGGVWPAYTTADTGSLFTVECTLCSPPTSLENIDANTLLSWIIRWLEFGWCYLGYILKCQIYGLINNIWQTIISFMAGVALFGKWIGLVVTAVANWVRDGFRFGFNNLVAAIIPIANQIIAWLFSLPIIQAALDTLAIAGIWLDGLFQLIQSVIDLILLGVQFIGALLNLIGVAWNAFLAALSATPSSDFPFPDCNVPSSPLYHACIPLDVTNFLVDHLPGIVLLINVAAFSVFWRQFRKIVRAVREDIFEQA